MKYLNPGSTIGIIGGGQLARMMILEGRKMGYRFIVIDPDENCACANITEELICAPWSSLNAAIELSKKCDVVTIDTEHVPWQSLQAMEEHTTVFPPSQTLKSIQDRLTQRLFLDNLGLPQTNFANVESKDDCKAALEKTKTPAVLKTRTWGYDGKGQVVVTTPVELESAWEKLGEVPCILESFINFQDEVSVLLARTQLGEHAQLKTYPLAKNIHANHILHKTLVPSGYPMDIEKKCFAIAKQIVDAFEYVGVMAIEMFVTGDGDVLVNEIAPRTHNSGHFTYGGCQTSQFEQHIRAVTGQPLLETTLYKPAVMVNLLGDLWESQKPDFSQLTKHPLVTLHWYGKSPVRKGRKMGHFLVQGDDIEALQSLAQELFDSL